MISAQHTMTYLTILQKEKRKEKETAIQKQNMLVHNWCLHDLALVLQKHLKYKSCLFVLSHTELCSQLSTALLQQHA